MVQSTLEDIHKIYLDAFNVKASIIWILMTLLSTSHLLASRSFSNLKGANCQGSQPNQVFIFSQVWHENFLAKNNKKTKTKTGGVLVTLLWPNIESCRCSIASKESETKMRFFNQLFYKAVTLPVWNEYSPKPTGRMTSKTKMKSKYGSKKTKTRYHSENRTKAC